MRPRTTAAWLRRSRHERDRHRVPRFPWQHRVLRRRGPAVHVEKATVELGVTDDAEATLEAFKNREAEGTTGMMGGFAIPHCKSDIVKQATVMVVKFSGEVAWSSMDNAPIKCAIALLIPAAQAGDVHLQLLSHVAVLVMDEHFRADVLASDGPEQIAALLNEGLAE